MDKFVKYVNTANKTAQSAYNQAKETMAYAIQLGGFRFKQSEKNPHKLIGTVPNNVGATIIINLETGLPVPALASTWNMITKVARREKTANVIVGNKVPVHSQREYQAKVLADEISELRNSLDQTTVENIDNTANWPEFNQLLMDAVEGKPSAVKCFPADVVSGARRK